MVLRNVSLRGWLAILVTVVMTCGIIAISSVSAKATNPGFTISDTEVHPYGANGPNFNPITATLTVSAPYIYDALVGPTEVKFIINNRGSYTISTDCDPGGTPCSVSDLSVSLISGATATPQTEVSRTLFGSQLIFSVLISSDLTAGDSIELTLPSGSLGVTPAYGSTSGTRIKAFVVNAPQDQYGDTIDTYAFQDIVALTDVSYTKNSSAASGVMSPEIQRVGSTFPLPVPDSSFLYTGKVFGGWDDLSAIYQPGDPYIVPDGGVTFYATWINPPQQTVTFNPNRGGGSGGGTMAVQTTNVSTPLRANTFTNTGFNFTGWSDASAGTVQYVDSAYYPFTSSTTLYAIWAAVTVSHTVTFDANDGTGTPATTTQTSSSAANLTGNGFTRTGYTFGGWATSRGGSLAYVNSASYGFGADLPLYAIWTPVSNAVTYNVHGGSAVSAGSFPTGGSVTLGAAPSLAGYTFEGWYTAASGGTRAGSAGASYSPGGTSAVELHAQWAPVNNAVTYNVHGGSVVSAGTFPTGGSVTLGAAPSLAGYTFAGWYTAASGGTRVGSAGASYSPGGTSAVELHAQWTAVQSGNTVTFNANGGTGTMTAQTSGSAAVLTTNTIARTGYGFTGWNTAANGSGTSYAVDATHPFTSSETLYAQWRALPAAPVAAVDIQVPVGSAIANAPVALDIDGLKDQTEYVVTVFSTPQIVDQGTIWSGRLNTTVRIPSNLEAGWHRLVIEGTAADGTPWTEENYFKVSPGGILLATSEVVPAELAMTGSNSVPVFYGAGALIILGIGFLLTNTTLRRRVKQKD
jgi:uncharacterized repeat protein (TIGR02543 family)